MKVGELVLNLENTINGLKKLPQDIEVWSIVDEGGYCESYKQLYVNFQHEIEEEDKDSVYFTILLEDIGREE